MAKTKDSKAPGQRERAKAGHLFQTLTLDRLGVKMAAVMLFLIYTIFAIFSTIAVSLMTEFGFYSATLEQTRSNVYCWVGETTASNALEELYKITQNEDITRQEILHLERGIGSETLRMRTQSNIYLLLLDDEGKIIASDYNEETPQYVGKITVVLCEDEEGQVVRVMRYVIPLNKKGSGALYVLDQWLGTIYAARFLMVIICLVSLTASILLFVLLLNAAGRYPDGVSPRLSALDHIPGDILLAFYGVIAYFEYRFFHSISFWWDTGWIVPSILLGLVDIPLFLLLFMSMATRVKCGNVIDNTLCAKVLRYVFRFLRAAWDNVIVPIFKALYHILESLPLMWKTSAALLSMVAIELVMLLVFKANTVLLALWIAEKVVEVPLVLWVVMESLQLRRGGEALAKGDYQYQIDEGKLHGALQEHAKNLNSIREGMMRVVEDRMRSERFQTELITNVSHDIKTPLTSIINYVDLLRKQPFATGDANGYLDILDHQAAKLKKLMEDLLEASKASTGNISTEIVPIDLDLMLSQAVGEYEERLNASELTPMVQVPVSMPLILADGKLLWRVLDNLLSNVIKYAMKGSRVYIAIALQEDQVVLTMRNVSSASLNISADELLQRFVRGDSSRHTEGSGLGLAIAQSLMEVMGGQLVLTVDGDLFKVELRFAMYHEPPAEPADAENALPEATDATDSAPDAETTVLPEKKPAEQDVSDPKDFWIG